MGYPTHIEWTDATWNPIGGCSIKSVACAPCYAQQLAGTRLKDHPLYAGTTSIVKGKPVFNGYLTSADLLHPVWTWPMRWRGAPTDKRKLGPDSPSLIFVGDMSDLFHEDRSEAVIDRVVTVIMLSKHIGQLLTKRPDVMLDYFESMERCFHGDIDNFQARWGHQAVDLTGSPCAAGAVEDIDFPVPNIWLGFTAERQKEFDERWPSMRALAQMGFTIFCSYEPAMGPLVLPDDFLALGRRAQVIAGGMSGRGATPSHPDWFRHARDQCLISDVAFFFKQHGEYIGVQDLRRLPGGSGPGFGTFDHCNHDMAHEAVRVGKRAAGRLLDGCEHNEFPRAE